MQNNIQLRRKDFVYIVQIREGVLIVVMIIFAKVHTLSDLHIVSMQTFS